MVELAEDEPEDIQEEEKESEGMEEEVNVKFRLPEVKRLPTWLQLTICTSVLLFMIYLAIFSIGKEEYNMRYCEKVLDDAGLDRFSNEQAVLFEDQKTKQYFGRSRDGERLWGCCRIPKGQEEVSLRENCVHAPNYDIPNFGQRVDYFLKKFIYKES